MLNPDAEKVMKSAVDDMIEYFLVRVSQIATNRYLSNPFVI